MFPETRLTLIQRLASRGADDDWRQFVADYWGPVCRFAGRTGRLSSADAEDVASEVFVAILQNRLLERWSGARTARLRTLLCSVVRNILSNRFRVQQGRANLLKEDLHEIQAQGWADSDGGAATGGGDDADPLYADWADSLLDEAVRQLVDSYHREGKGNYSRVLYGRLCEELSAAEIAGLLNLKLTDVDNYYRHAQKRLRQMLEDALRQHISRYTPAEDVPAEFSCEWNRLAEFLIQHGGLEDVVRRLHPSLSASAGARWDHVQRRLREGRPSSLPAT